MGWPKIYKATLIIQPISMIIATKRGCSPLLQSEKQYQLLTPAYRVFSPSCRPLGSLGPFRPVLRRSWRADSVRDGSAQPTSCLSISPLTPCLSFHHSLKKKRHAAIRAAAEAEAKSKAEKSQ